MRKSKKKTTKSNSILSLVVFGLCTLIILTITFYYVNKYFSIDDSDKLVYEKPQFSYLNHFEVHGIDVSKHNGHLNWEEINHHTINDWELKFVFIRASVALADGTLIEDKKFDENWSQAKSHDLICGAYHFYSPAVSVNEQVKLFTEEVHLGKGDLPPVLDIENFERGNIFITSKDLPKIERWLTAIEAHYGVKPIIYTSKKMYLDYFRKPKFKKYYFWIANYGEKILSIEKHEWKFWQHCEDGKINKHGCDFDLNVFNGSENELESICIH